MKEVIKSWLADERSTWFASGAALTMFIYDAFARNWLEAAISGSLFLCLLWVTYRD